MLDYTTSSQDAIVAAGAVFACFLVVGGGSKEEGWRRRPQGMGNEPEVGRPSSPCEMRESLWRVERAQGEVRKPKCQRTED